MNDLLQPETLGLYLGTRVHFTRVLRRGVERRPSRKPYSTTQTDTWKVWSPKPLWHLGEDDYLAHPALRLRGIVMGLRTLQNGIVEYGGYDEPTTFYREESIPAALIAWHLRRKPCLVALDNLEVIA